MQPDRPPLTVVSGLPRSGTSLVMQMLDAGGMPILTDGHRLPDEDNPRGYFELEAVKQLGRNAAWLEHSAGKAVKVIHLLLRQLPLDAPVRYQVVLMRRDVREVLSSQARMLKRQGRAGAQLPAEQLAATYAQQLAQCTRWMAEHPRHFRVLEVEHRRLLEGPEVCAAMINQFVGGALDERAMAAVVDPTLYRNRA